MKLTLHVKGEKSALSRYIERVSEQNTIYYKAWLYGSGSELDKPLSDLKADQNNVSYSESTTSC